MYLYCSLPDTCYLLSGCWLHTEVYFLSIKGTRVILSDANDLPVHQLEEWKRKVEKKKELWEEHKEKAKRSTENTQQQDDCPRLSRERKHLCSKLGPYWALP
jgi:hypothetical protein